MRVYLVDDEESARGVLRFYLEEMEENITIVGEQGDSVKAISEINHLQPDLVFLDIQMPVLNGFDMLPYLEPRPLIVFCTAFDQYAIDAFEARALDYLLKPVEPKRLAQSMTRAADEWEKQIKLAHGGEPGLEKVLCAVGDGHRVVWVRDILKISRSDRYTVIQIRDGQQLYSDLAISWMEEHITDPNFFRLGRGCIIHKDYIKGYQTLASGNWAIETSVGESEILPRRRVKEFRSWFGI